VPTDTTSYIQPDYTQPSTDSADNYSTPDAYTTGDGTGY
jgi:hypothetical protein